MGSRFILLVQCFCGSFLRIYSLQLLTRVSSEYQIAPPSKDAPQYWPVGSDKFFNRSAREPARYLEPPDSDSVSSYEDFWTDSDFPRNHQPDPTPLDKRHRLRGPVRDHDPAPQTILESTLQTKKKTSNKNLSKALELSSDGDRVEFQIQGHEGPKTYIFGFDTGDGKNRQFRLEEKLKDGTVKGHYGYYDARGKLRTIKYLARPIEGYQEKHHESNDVS